MSSGRVHAAVSISASILALVGTVALGSPDPGLSAGLLLSVLLTPDLDQVDESRGLYSYRYLRKLGLLPVRLWHAFWWLYAKAFPHRSLWTHCPGLGTAFRLAYIGIIPALILLAMGYNIVSLLVGLAQDPNVRAIFWGLCLGDELHLIFDFFAAHPNGFTK